MKSFFAPKNSGPTLNPTIAKILETTLGETGGMTPVERAKEDSASLTADYLTAFGNIDSQIQRLEETQ
jgi:hypothetical protein